MSQHLIISAVAAVCAWKLSGSGRLAAASVAGGVLPDLDHLFDYVREHGPDPDLQWFFETFRSDHYRRIILPFHCWELLPVLLAAAWLTRWNTWITGTLIGMTHHLVADQFTNRPHPLGYSLLWRVHTRFAYGKSFVR